MSDVIRRSGSKNINQLKGNKYFIGDDIINLGKTELLATLISTGVFHDYNFDGTSIKYINNEEIKTIKSTNTLSKGQVIAVLHLLRLYNLEVLEIKHTADNKEYGYIHELSISGISNKNNSITITSPEDNGWIFEKAIADYKNNERNYFNKVYSLYIDNISINELVTLINKSDTVIGVNKIIGDGLSISIIESESIVVALTDNHLVITEITSGMASTIAIKEVYKLSNVHNKRIEYVIAV